MRVPFCPTRYKTYDSPGKEALVSLLEQWGHEVLNVEENYLADITSSKDGVEHYSEAEVKSAWAGDWPEKWKEVRLPGRKLRLLKKHPEVTFYIFSNKCDRVWVIEKDQLTLENLKPAYGPGIYRGENFFHVPAKEIRQLHFREGSWVDVVYPEGFC